MPKDRIIATLGESELLLPDLMSRALSANDRVKYLLTLLQSARSAADGDADASDLREERLASEVADSSLDRVVHGSLRRDDGSYAIPGVAALAHAALERGGDHARAAARSRRGGIRPARRAPAPAWAGGALGRGCDHRGGNQPADGRPASASRTAFISW